MPTEKKNAIQVRPSREKDFSRDGCLKKNDAMKQAVKKELEDMGFTPKITKYNFCTNGITGGRLN